MGYLATTHYLSRKLNWMARKIKDINEPSDIKEWTDAMMSVYHVLEDFSKNEEVSSPLWFYC